MTGIEIDGPETFSFQIVNVTLYVGGGTEVAELLEFPKLLGRAYAWEE